MTSDKAERQPSTLSNTESSRAALGELKAKVADDLGSARDTLNEEATTAVQKVKDAAVEKTTLVARKVGGIGTALEKVAVELENSDQPQVGQYAKQIGNSVTNFAKQMEGKDLGDVATMAEQFGRKQPLAFLGVAALAGFAASRFLTASANRLSTSSPTERSDPGADGSDNVGSRSND